MAFISVSFLCKENEPKSSFEKYYLKTYILNPIRGGTLITSDFINILNEVKLINVIKEEKQMDKALETDSKIAFLLTGNITNLKTYVDCLKKRNKLVFIHVEMIGGLNCDKDGIKFIAKYVKPTGIISTKKNILKAAKKYRLLTVQRVFAIDTDAVNTSIKLVNDLRPDVVEIMPSRMPEIIELINEAVTVPVIAGGLIKKRIHIEEALDAGAIAVASGTPKIWEEKL